MAMHGRLVVFVDALQAFGCEIKITSMATAQFFFARKRVKAEVAACQQLLVDYLLVNIVVTLADCGT